jgi:hypothetical protein
VASFRILLDQRPRFTPRALVKCHSVTIAGLRCPNSRPLNPGSVALSLSISPPAAPVAVVRLRPGSWRETR